MKKINTYITEKLHINKDVKTIFTFNHDGPQATLNGYTWILNYYFVNTVQYLLEWTLDHCTLRDEEEKFIKEFINDINKFKQTKSTSAYDEAKDKISVLNYIKNKCDGTFQKPKCIYDICVYLINNNIEPSHAASLDFITQIKNDIEHVSNGHINQLDWAY